MMSARAGRTDATKNATDATVMTKSLRSRHIADTSIGNWTTTAKCNRCSCAFRAEERESMSGLWTKVGEMWTFFRGDERRDVDQPRRFALFLAECGEWIDATCAARWHIARRQRH